MQVLRTLQFPSDSLRQTIDYGHLPVVTLAAWRGFRWIAVDFSAPRWLLRVEWYWEDVDGPRSRTPRRFMTAHKSPERSRKARFKVRAFRKASSGERLR